MEKKDHFESIFFFKKVYLAYWDKLYEVAWSRTKDEEVAKDIVQDVFFVCWQKTGLIPRESFNIQYLMGILKYKLLDYFRSEKIKAKVLEHIYAQMEVFAVQADDLLRYKELKKELEKEIDSMPYTMQQSFLLKLDGNSNQEIANKLNLADQTVHNKLSEAYKRIRKRFLTKPRNTHFTGIYILLYVVNHLLTIK